MTQTAMAVLIFGALCAGALIMFVMERRAVAKRKADGTFVDISDIVFFGSEAVAKHNAETKDG